MSEIPAASAGPPGSAAPVVPPAPAPPGGGAPAQQAPPPAPASPGVPEQQPAARAPYGLSPLPPRPSGFLQRAWPAPGQAADQAVLAGIIAAGVIAAASLPLDRPGIGWLITGVSAAAATAIASRRATAPAGRVARAERIGWGTGALALLGVGTVRAAGWLFVLCVLTACVAASLAVTRGRTVRGLALGPLMVPLAAGRAVPWAVRGLVDRRQAKPTPGGGGEQSANAARLVATIAVSVVLLVVFGSLFVTADPAFARVLNNVLPDISAGTVARWFFVFLVVGFGTLGAAYLVSAPPTLDGGTSGAGRVRRLEWVLPLALLDALFVAFVLVQLAVLFGGARHVLRTAELTYAEYARGGFWQLLVVTALTLVVIMSAARWAPRDTGTDRLLIRALLGGLAVLTLVIVASALYRMRVYEEAYGFTRLRVFVSTVELWLGAVFIMVLVAGVRLAAGWLPRAISASSMVALFGLAVLNPDRFIADRNIDRYTEIGRLDTYYLRTLSADAVPALDRLPAGARECALVDLADELSAPDGWQDYNLARTQARHLLADRPVMVAGSCRDYQG